MKRPLILVAIIAVIIAAVRCMFFTDASAAFKFIEHNNSLNVLTYGEIYKKTDYEAITSVYLKNCKITYDGVDYSSGNISATLKKDMAADLRIGDIIQGESVVSIPEGSRNDGGFDEKMYLFSNGIELKSKITSIKNINKSDIPIYIFSDYINQLLSQSYSNISPDHSDILNTIILGNKAELNKDTKQIYRNAGMSHLLSISGVKTLKLDIPLVPETRIKWALMPLHIAKIYILKLCLDEEIIPRCRFPCSRGYLTKCINQQKKQ